MPKFSRNFVSGKMNKTFDERVVPNGEYIDAMNVRMGSTENSEFGVIENTKGNLPLTALKFLNTPLSVDARCIGAYEDGAMETVYWFVHDPNFPLGLTGKLDLLLSFNTNNSFLTYHVITIDNGGNINTTLNFNPKYLITGVNKIENLLFFTDNYNAPRVININRNYAVPSGAPLTDAGGIAAALLLEESLLVIKKPPTESPTVQLLNTVGQQNFLEQRFISFAYRYLYADGEYSATSQWSDIAFAPNGFEVTVEAYLNEGMINSFNACKVTYYTGNSLVVGIDLLFKQSESNIIKIIEKQNKQVLGIPNNIYTSISFDNSKIFTTLPESELLRLYDNVPRFAQAQTLMGNRLMYGNYIEGYDLVTSLGNPVQFTYETALIQDSIGLDSLVTSKQSSTYLIDGGHVVPFSILRIDFANLVPYASNLISGASIGISIEFSHESFTGSPSLIGTTPNTSVSATFFLTSNYSSPYDLAQSVEFQDWIGTVANILPVYDPIPANPTSCDGYTFTDKFNCLTPTNLAANFEKRAAGIDAVGEPIKIISSNLNSYIDLQIVATQYEDTTSLGTYGYEYYQITNEAATFSKVGQIRSLHSNRGYEVGIVYMDDFLRSSTALVSVDNTVYTPCSSSVNQNSIRVTIPTSQVAPYWATRYKFVIKPDQEGYQTVYSTLLYIDSANNNLYWFLLEGENQQKVEVGDRLIVKKDSNGASQECVYTTVLEKGSQAFPFPGVYMRLETVNFAATVPSIPPYTDSDTVCCGTISPVYVSWSEIGVPPRIDLDVPAGSVIGIMAYTYRPPGIFGCDKREINPAQAYVYFTATNNYNNLEDWFVFNQAAILSALGALPSTGMTISYQGAYGLSFLAMNSLAQGGIDEGIMKLYINRDPADNHLTFWITGTDFCTNSVPITTIKFKLNRAPVSPEFVFETAPIDALPDVFFENNLSFGITSIGEHEGNVQNQDFLMGQPAIINTGFFNCFSFGNGVESYKIRDSIIGREFNLGERVTSVSAQDYKEAHRFSDITYSGIYNPESNLNKLNEFNLGLLNYKYLESSFGYIYILDGRETDVLCIQEDKISYVLAGKNLLSDAGAGRALLAVPEVLGTQIARTEKFGISHNPESYVQWGADRYFTDVKRGAVIQLQGDSAQNDKLQVVSEFGMRTWFRDEFIYSQTTQKLGGYDPYMNEYVLTSNDISIPIVTECFDCDQDNTFSIDNSSNSTDREINYCIELNDCIGIGTITIATTSISLGGSFTVSATYDGTTTSTLITSVGIDTVSYNVNNPSVLTLEINIIISAGTTIGFDINNECQECEKMKLIEVVITDNSNAGFFIHNQYNYTDVTIPYTSPLQSNQVTFASGTAVPLVSYYNAASGFQGQGSFPYPGVDMTLYTNKIGFDNYDFIDPPNRFLWTTTNTNYPNTPASIAILLSIANVVTPIVTVGNQNSAVFSVPSLFDNLYLIWDLRSTTEVELCYSEVSCDVACLECSVCECGSWLVVNNTGESYFGVQYVNCDGINGVIGEFDPVSYTFPRDAGLFICARSFPEPVDGFIYMYLGCYCCKEECTSYSIVNNSIQDIDFVGYLTCGVEDPNEVVTFNKPFTPVEICFTASETMGYFEITTGIDFVESLDFSLIECGCAAICCSTYIVWNDSNAQETDVNYVDCNGMFQTVTLAPLAGITLCAISIEPTLNLNTITLNACICCTEDCFTLTIENNSGQDITINGDFLCNGLPFESFTYLSGANPYTQCWNKNATFTIITNAPSFGQ